MPLDYDCNLVFTAGINLLTKYFPVKQKNNIDIQENKKINFRKLETPENKKIISRKGLKVQIIFLIKRHSFLSNS